MLNTFYILFKQRSVPGMKQGGPEEFYKMCDQYKNETDVDEQALILQALCQFRTPSLIR